LQNEYAALLDESHALHWIIRSSDGHPWGLLSLTDISRPSKKAEVLLGVLPNAPLGLATAAILVLFQFFFKAMKFNKLYSLVYKDNLRSLKSTLHLGFKIEGDLRQEIIDPKTGNFVDLIRTGLLAEDAFNASNIRLMDRLLT
jgi:RimJ/RimL family protein N-acetyltransferase